ncbi:MAG: universal stress protein [Halobacteriales archaeon]|nr:universal stress protein [Halobacteriales archaeon]
MYDRILLPVDGSSALEPTVTHGLDIAASYGATVQLLRIHPEDAEGDSIAVTSSRETAQTVSARTADVIADRTSDVDLAVKQTDAYGTPSAVIETWHEQFDPDLIVMPSRTDERATPVERSFVEVAGMTPTPVLGVPTAAETESASGYTLFDSILVGTDGSDRSRAASEMALKLAERYGATIHALYVLDTESLDRTDTTGGELSVLRAGGQQAVEEIETQGQAISVPVTPQLKKGNAAEQLIESATTIDADLLVVGTQGERTDPPAKELGGTTEAVIRHATRPILTVG